MSHVVKVTRYRGKSVRSKAWRASCETCSWKGKPRPTRSESNQDAGLHRLEVRHG